ncbi:MAG: tetratricopeptide repeat protein [Bacteroidia bacterium]
MIILFNVVETLSEERKALFHEVEKFAYSLYLKEALNVKFHEGKRDNVEIKGEPFSQSGLEKRILNTTGTEHPRTRAIFRWIEVETIPDIETLEVIYQTFKQKDEKSLVELLSFDELIAEFLSVSEYLKDNIEHYESLKKIEKNKRKTIDKDDVVAYIEHRFAKTHSSNASDAEIRNAYKALLSLVLLLSTGKNTLAKDAELHRIDKELEKIKEEKFFDQKAEISKIIKDYRNTNPLNIFQKFIAKISSAIGLFLVLSVSVLAGYVYSRKQSSLPPDFLRSQEEYLENGYVSQTDTLFHLLQDSLNNFTTSNIDSGDYWYKEAKKIYMTDEWDIKIDYFSKALKFNPTRGAIYYHRGSSYESIGFEYYDEAISDYTNAIKYRISDTIIFNGLYSSRGRLKMALKDYAGAEADYNTFLDLTNEWKNSTMPKEALKWANIVISSAYKEIAFACYKQGNYQKALEKYKAAIQLNDPDGYDGYEKYNGLALTYAQMDSLAPAIDAFGETLHYCSYRSDTIMSYDGIFSCYKAMGDKEYHDFYKSERQKNYIITHYNGAIAYLDKILSCEIDKDNRLKYEEQKALLLARISELD